jgi:hypothetical protein
MATAFLESYIVQNLATSLKNNSNGPLFKHIQRLIIRYSTNWLAQFNWIATQTD